MSCVMGEVLYQGKCHRGREVTLAHCVACGYAHLHPLPSEEETAAYYREDYYQAEKPVYDQQHDDEAAYWAEVYDEQWNSLPYDQTAGGRIVDLGCGRRPDWLTWLHDTHLRSTMMYNWCVGIDPALSEQTEMHCGKLRRSWGESGINPGDAELIHSAMLLEHVPDPLRVLWEARSYLSPGGVLLLEVPFDTNPLQRWLDDHHFVTSPDHLNYFTPATIRQLVERAGFRVLEQRTTYPVELLLVHGHDYRADDADGATRRLIRSRRADWQRFWRETGMSRQLTLGRTTWLVASKHGV